MLLASVISREFVVNMLQTALDWWNKLVGWSLALLTEDITLVWNGALWTVISSVYNVLMPVGLALCVTNFLIGLFSTAPELIIHKRVESLIFAIVRYILTYSAVVNGLLIIKTIVKISQGCVGYVIAGAGGMKADMIFSMPGTVKNVILDCSRLEQIGYFVLSLLVFLCVLVFGFQLLLIVVGRFNRLGITAALFAVGLSWFGGAVTKDMGRAHLKTYLAVCMEGLVLVVSLLISSVLVSSFGVKYTDNTTMDPSGDKVYSVKWSSEKNEVYVTVSNAYSTGGYTAAYYDYPTNKYAKFVKSTSVTDDMKKIIGDRAYYQDNVGDTYTFYFENRSGDAIYSVVNEFIDFKTAKAQSNSNNAFGNSGSGSLVLEWMLVLVFNAVMFVSMVRGVDSFTTNLIRGG